jgi:hypothetical protein
MEHTVIKKRLNTYKSDGGRLRKVDDEVVLDVLRAWENWEGNAAELYRELGLSRMQLVTMIQKAKKLVKNGAATGSDFKELRVTGAASGGGAGYAIELSWKNGKLIRFSVVKQLIEFLKLAGQDADV